MSATPALAFITHRTAKERAQARAIARGSHALDEALAAIHAASARHAEACVKTRARWLAGSAFPRREEVRAMMHPHRIAYLLSRYPMSDQEMLSDEVLAEIRRRLANVREAGRLHHWIYDRNRELALRNAYLAVRWARFLSRQAVRTAAMAAE
ncbi:hypothetical protein GCM10007276_34610 [Agaricicola taiwanensis]|uniref:Uncharacterized protein n=1 Tax=Agaricicola taiwanensis TaxID=591372 RepID=A0A8J2YNL9_9RHOB|nr:hypothetical protein [Agaricicola taiwanensis]GGE54662.1 hypothetical protein GCM10007276_34610 [Agaricicola taiwanensis]